MLGDFAAGYCYYYYWEVVAASSAIHQQEVSESNMISFVKHVFISLKEEEGWRKCGDYSGR